MTFSLTKSNCLSFHALVRSFLAVSIHGLLCKHLNRYQLMVQPVVPNTGNNCSIALSLWQKVLSLSLLTDCYICLWNIYLTSYIYIYINIIPLLVWDHPRPLLKGYQAPLLWVVWLKGNKTTSLPAWPLFDSHRLFGSLWHSGNSRGCLRISLSCQLFPGAEWYNWAWCI